MIIKYSDIQQRHIKQSFLSKINPVVSRGYDLESQINFTNYTTLFHSTQQHLGIGNQVYQKQQTKKFIVTLQYIYYLSPEFHLGYRYNREIKKHKHDFSFYYNLNESSQITFCSSFTKLKNKQKILFTHKDNSFIIKENQVKLCLFPFNTIKPYLKTDFKQTTLGLKLQLKQFELFAYKSFNTKNEDNDQIQKLDFTIGVALNVKDWKFGFKLFNYNDQGFISLFVQKLGIGFQLPILELDFEDKLHKYTTIGIMIAIGCSILKCFQQPKILPLTRQQRIDESRNKLILLEDKTKAIYKYEKNNNGLLIMYAYYGNSDHINILFNQQNKQKYQLQNELEVIDVTLACQFMIKNSTLHLPSYSKQVLYGFCDPCEDTKQDKQLLLEFDYKGDRMCKIYKDLEEVKIP